jgi:hypothetical protein
MAEGCIRKGRSPDRVYCRLTSIPWSLDKVDNTVAVTVTVAECVMVHVDRDRIFELLLKRVLANRVAALSTRVWSECCSLGHRMESVQPNSLRTHRESWTPWCDVAIRVELRICLRRLVEWLKSVLAFASGQLKLDPPRLYLCPRQHVRTVSTSVPNNL